MKCGESVVCEAGMQHFAAGEYTARRRKLMILGGHYVTGAAGRESLEREGKQTPKNKPRRPWTECFLRGGRKEMVMYVPYDGGAGRSEVGTGRGGAWGTAGQHGRRVPRPGGRRLACFDCHMTNSSGALEDVSVTLDVPLPGFPSSCSSMARLGGNK